MGYAVARAAQAAGHSVMLIAGPTGLAVPEGVVSESVISAADMLEAVQANLDWCDGLVMCAAVADWRPVYTSPAKLKKRSGPPVLELETTPDILLAVRARKGQRIYVGFAAETDNLELEAERKLHAKGLDLIVANDVGRSDAGFEVETNEVVFIPAEGKRQHLPLMSKDAVAQHIIEWMDSRWQRGKT